MPRHHQERERHQRHFAIFGGSGFARQSVGFGVDTPTASTFRALAVPAVSLDDGRGVRGAFHHNWDRYWSTALFSQLLCCAVSRRGQRNLLGAGTTTAKGADCAAFAANHGGQAGTSGDNACNDTGNPDFNVSQLGVVLVGGPSRT